MDTFVANCQGKSFRSTLFFLCAQVSVKTMSPSPPHEPSRRPLQDHVIQTDNSLTLMSSQLKQNMKIPSTKIQISNKYDTFVKNQNLTQSRKVRKGNLLILKAILLAVLTSLRENILFTRPSNINDRNSKFKTDRNDGRISSSKSVRGKYLIH